MSRHKIIDHHTFYICDQKKDCSNSKRCGTDCRHTEDVSHKKYKDISDKKRKWYHKISKNDEGQISMSYDVEKPRNEDRRDLLIKAADEDEDISL